MTTIDSPPAIAQVPDRPPLRVVMFVYNDVSRDSRVLREAASLADAGMRVLVVGRPKSPDEREITRFARGLKCDGLGEYGDLTPGAFSQPGAASRPSCWSRYASASPPIPSPVRKSQSRRETVFD